MVLFILVYTPVNKLIKILCAMLNRIIIHIALYNILIIKL